MDGMTGSRTFGPASLMLSIPTSVPKAWRERMRELTHLSVPHGHRNQGLAEQLMIHVCSEADQCGFVLMLTVEQFDPAIDTERLERFYGRFGFVRLQNDPILMARPATPPINHRLKAATDAAMRGVH